MWDLPGPGLEPVFPALAGGFPTMCHQGSPHADFLSLWILRALITYTCILAFYHFLTYYFLCTCPQLDFKISASVTAYSKDRFNTYSVSEPCVSLLASHISLKPPCSIWLKKDNSSFLLLLISYLFGLLFLLLYFLLSSLVQWYTVGTI